MRKFVIALVAALSLSFAFAEEAKVDLQQTCQTAEQAKSNATSDQLAQQVLCCCPVSGGGSCCKYQSGCFGGFVNGCFCTGHSIESEPLNSNASEGKVRT